MSLTKKDISIKYNLNPIVSEILTIRGIDTKEKIDNFLYGSFEDLYDPKKIPDIDQIIKKIKTHALFGDKIMIYGDYDVDGITSISILYRALNRLGKNVDVEWMVSNRYKDGYGLSKRAVNKMSDKDVDLLITLDCGISDNKEIELAKRNDIDVIVVDHHERDGEKPKCLYLDLKVKSGDYPFKELCGCGVTWKLCQVLLKDDLYDLIDIVAMATVADVVPLVNENRIIVKEGLKKIKENDINVGIKELMRRNEIDNKDIKTHHFGYKICPMLNAPGRLDTADICVEFLTTDHQMQASGLAFELQQQNEKRKNMTERLLEDAIDQANPDDNVLFYQKEMLDGVVGIIAGDIKEHFNKPSIVLGGKEDKLLKGSCRSVRPLNIYETLKKCEDILNSYGGHKMAAGLSIKKDNFEDFYNKIQKISEGIEYQDVKFDMIKDPVEMSMKLVEDINGLSPFGRGNPKPKFLTKNIKATGIKKLRGGHLKFKVNSIDCIAFGMEDKYKDISNNKFDLIYQPDINKYRGNISLQLKAKKIKPNIKKQKKLF